MSYKTDLQANNTALQAALATAQSLPDAGSGGGSSVEIYNDSAIIWSTAEVSVIYSALVSDAVELITADSTYISAANQYRCSIAPEVLIHTPIVILSSGTITFSHATLQSSGSGYAIYTLDSSEIPEAGPEREEL